MRNLVRYLVRDDQEVDDLAHEALVEVLRSLGSFRGDGSRRAWVDRIVVRTVFARRRRNRGRVDTDADPVCIDSIPHGRTPPDHYAARRRALALIDRLPTEQRDAIVLHHVAGLRVREVALVVDAPEETVKSRLRLAKHRVMDLLEQGATP